MWSVMVTVVTMGTEAYFGLLGHGCGNMTLALLLGFPISIVCPIIIADEPIVDFMVVIIKCSYNKLIIRQPCFNFNLFI